MSKRSTAELSSKPLSTSEINRIGLGHVPAHYSPDLYRLRHSCAHLLAQAVSEHFAGEGEVQFGIGPAITDGFYYDFVLPRPLSDQELPKIEERMRRIIAQRVTFNGKEVSEEEARKLFASQPLKLELIDGLVGGSLDDNGEEIPTATRPRLTVFEQGGFVDLCRGPHIASTADINPNAVKLRSVSGVYWKGDSKNQQMVRIYGTAWTTKEDLETYEWRLAEAEKRDHRKLGKQLKLFHLDETAPGMPYWLPKGLVVLNELIEYWRKEHKARGYQEISSPIVNKKELWEQSGHWEHYRDDMFVIPIDENNTYAVKPMNCPNAMVVFNLEIRSYRDLPFRLSDCDVLHRHEASGALHGLLRVQKFQQDDAHIFVSEDQVEAEYDRVLKICDEFYGVFGLKYHLRLGTRPKDFMGDIESWNRAESSLRSILNKHRGEGGYAIAEGDGAFYGPKIDIMMEDAIGRHWQMGTMQLDFQLPRRFNCKYTDAAGAAVTPIVIHRVIYGSLERFIGILIEHCAGAFPLWIAPVQAVVVPIADRHQMYAREVEAQLDHAGIRVRVDDSNERMNAKIRQAQLDKIPYILVVGDKEVEDGAVSVRLRTKEDLGAMPVAALRDRMLSVISHKGEI